MISETNTHMLSLLADVLHDKRPGKVSEAEWPALLKELFAQSVYALPTKYIHDLGLSAKDEASYLKAVIKNRQVFHSLMKDQERVLSVLEAANIPAVIIKGAAAAVYYPDPEKRCMGDVDILVMPQDFEKAYEALVSAGCTAKQTSDDFYRHISLLAENSTVIELHHYFSTSDNPEQNALLDELLYHAIPSRVSDELCGYPVLMLPAAENGLVLLGHINQHLSCGLGLRQIVDWMYYVEKYLDDEFWENSFADMAEQIGMKRLAMVTTAMCRKYLGLNKDIHWCSYEPVCDELMEYILNHGNFGRKVEKTKGRTVSVLKRARNPIHGLAVAQSYGLINWKASKKHRCLRPFAWIYQLGRWATKGIKSGVTIGTLNEASSSAKAETEFLKKLDVTRL